MPEQKKIYSRFYFDNFLIKEVSRARLTGRPVSLLLIEPKFLFSPHNKEQQQLEPLLSRMAEITKDQIRSSDLLCRYQHHRMAILLPETAPEWADKLLERILTNLEASYPNHAILWYSAIISAADTDQNSAHGLLQQAHLQLKQFRPHP